MELEKCSVSELAYKLVPYIGKKAEEKGRGDLLRYDRFTESSVVSQREFAAVESFFFKKFDKTDFVELSPLQPLGLNCFLAETNGKKIVPTIRGQEVNSDATTALFLEAFRRFNGQYIDLATNVRTVRPKIFPAESKFLTHFKVFADVTIGIQRKPFGLNEILGIRDHLFKELDVLHAIGGSSKYSLRSIDVKISNVIFMNELLNMLTPDSCLVEHKKNSLEQALKHLGGKNLDKNWCLNINEDLLNSLKRLGMRKGLKILEMFLEASRSFLNTWNQEPLVHFYFDLSRSAGIDYYRHICYSIIGTTCQGEKIPLGDGGSTDWATKLSGNKQLFTVTSGIGTEVLVRNFKKSAL